MRLDERTADLAVVTKRSASSSTILVTAATSARLAELGVRVIALRCAGYNNVDVDAAKGVGLGRSTRAGVFAGGGSEHRWPSSLLPIVTSIAPISRVREAFALDGLLGRGLHGATAGVVGTGRIGQHVARLLVAFGCTVLAHDPFVDGELVALGVDTSSSMSCGRTRTSWP